MEPKRFYRNPEGRILGGVCSGLADYFVVDPVLVRIVFLVLAFAGGAGVLLYLILLIATPEKPYDFTQYDQKSATMENQENKPGPEYTPGSTNPDPYRNPRSNRSRGNLIGGLVLITLGVLFLADEFIPHIRFGDLWPLILVVIGIGLLINSITGRKRD